MILINRDMKRAKNPKECNKKQYNEYQIEFLLCNEKEIPI